MPEELTFLPSAGAIPGIPGEHAAGMYLIDWEARTIRPAQLDTPSEPVQLAEEPASPQPLASEPEND